MTDLAVIAVLATVLLLVVAGWALYARALRVDRLHRQVLGSRATVEAQLVHRAQAAADLAATGVLGPADSMLLSRAAHRALEAEGPLVDDGLAPRGDQWDPHQDAAPGRAAPESDLSRVLRTVLAPAARAQLEDTPLGAQALAQVDKAAYRLVLARRFHNTHVEQARSLRSTWVVRLFHLAGHAALPETFDIDDDTGPAHDPAGSASAEETP